MSTDFANNPEFSKLLVRQDDDVDLVRLMLEFAGDAYPQLDPGPALGEIDELVTAAREHLQRSRDADVHAQFDALGEFLCGREGFRGDNQSYYDPRNSYLNDVLLRRRGIPISLSIIYTAVGSQAGLDVFGVGTPAHFVVGCRDAGRIWYIDPFTDGAVLDLDGCRERIQQVLGERNVLTPEHFRAATSREIAARVLRNLKAAYAMQNVWPAALPVQQRLAALLPEVADESRDLGLIYLRNGDAIRAVALLDRYVQSADGPAAEAVLPFLKTARRMAAERN